jgi:hypothetical protein
VSWLDAVVLFWALAFSWNGASRILRRRERWWAGAQGGHSPFKNQDPLAWIALRRENSGKPLDHGTVVVFSAAQIAFAVVVAAAWFASR